MTISDYELNEDVVIENPEVHALGRWIVFKFQNIFPKMEMLSTEKPLKAMPSVLIATSRVNTDEVISIHTNTATINIEVDAGYLNGLFELSEKSPVLDKRSRPFVERGETICFGCGLQAGIYQLKPFFKSFCGTYRDETETI